MSESNMSILHRKTPVALAAFIRTLRKAMKPEGRFEQGFWAPTEWASQRLLLRLEAVQEALEADAITPYEAASQTMQEIGDWLETIVDRSVSSRFDPENHTKRREKSDRENWESDHIEQEMQWCWKQGEKFAKNSHWLCVEWRNPRAMIESGQNPWKPSTLSCK
tara:strand:- start:1035 stop:1526 length:492 start_codon:yes stop_codon:yes gene_type:complete